MKKKKKYDKTLETAIISGIITDSFFTKIYEQSEIGAIGVFGIIAHIAIDFEKKYRKVTDWEAESEKQGCTDWEDCIIQFTKEQLKKYAIK